MVFKYLASLDQEENEYLLASLKILTNSENYSKNSIKFLFFCSIFPSLSLVYFLQCIHGQPSEQFSWSQAAFRTTFGATGFCQEVRKSSLKRVTGRIFITISKWLHRSKQKLHLEFSLQKESQKLWKHSSSIHKVLFWFLVSSKKILHLVTFSV